ncbi:MAG TPA: hypothetical protein EYQ81_16430 [Sneathiellales bacterium]|nr:hypothetical protein [Sneathiellales bacterium]
MRRNKWTQTLFQNALNQEFSDKLDRLDAEFDKKMEEQNKKIFADKPDEGTLSLDGKMLDKPHLTQAERVLKIARQFSG